MSFSKSCILRSETAKDTNLVDQLALDTFGPVLFERAAYHLRLGVAAEPHLSFVMEEEGTIIGSVRVTKIYWGDKIALMLGPLVVVPSHKGKGLGKQLMEKVVSQARAMVSKGEPDIMMLVGDLSYYEPFGFKRIPHDQISLPKPADQDRILACELRPGSLADYSGEAARYRTV